MPNSADPSVSDLLHWFSPKHVFSTDLPNTPQIVRTISVPPIKRLSFISNKQLQTGNVVFMRPGVGVIPSLNYDMSKISPLFYLPSSHFDDRSIANNVMFLACRI